MEFPILSVGDATDCGAWFVFGPKCQLMLNGELGSELQRLNLDPRAVTLEKSRGVYWLPCERAVADSGSVPLCPTRAAADPIALELQPSASSSSAAVGIAPPAQMALDEGGESRAVRAKRIPPEVSQ